MENTLFGLCLGIGLAAACGFRVFVPLFVASLGASTGHLTLAPDFAWMASPVATVCFGIATALEVLAYYVPAVDNALDAVAGPTAVIAGTLVTAAFVGDMSPFLRWTLAAIAGGGTAAATQGMTTVARLASTAGTGGLGNPVLSTGEAGSSLILSILALAMPVLTAIAVILLLVFSVRKIRAFLRRRRERREQRRFAAENPAPASAD